MGDGTEWWTAEVDGLTQDSGREVGMETGDSEPGLVGCFRTQMDSLLPDGTRGSL